MRTRRALVMAPVLPEFDRESGSRRIFDLLMFLCEAGWSVTFVAQRGAGGERYVRILQQAGIATYVGFDQLTDQMMSMGHFDLALFEFWNIAEQHLAFIRRASPETHVVVDSIDLHFVRHARRVFLPAQPGGRAGLLDNSYGSEMVRELNIYAAADGVLAVSEKEADMVNDLLGDPQAARCVPDCEEFEASTRPFSERKGILFLGSFRHTPNVDAIDHFCRQVIPCLDPKVLAADPLQIVGTGLDDNIRRIARGIPNVIPIGWVPSVLPYIERARIMVVPLLYGAGTKRKLVQSLMIGTPTVSTGVGIEGLGLTHRKQVLVGDNPRDFARHVENLCRDPALWGRLATNGRAHVLPVHGREVARKRFLTALDAVLERKPKKSHLTVPDQDHRYRISLHYQRLAQRVREAIASHVPEGATVLVASRGDPAFLQVAGRDGRHFPQDEGGGYAGYHPADSAAAISHLEQLRARGGNYFVLPGTAFWWRSFYGEFQRHLEATSDRVIEGEDAIIYQLN